jgi:hypothetical protein
MATENIEKRAKQEQQDLEQGLKVSIAELEGGDKVALEYNGKEFEFPKAQPAWVSMFIALHGEGKEKELSDEKSLEFLVKLVGRGLATEIVETADNDFSIADVAEQIVQPIQSYWSEPVGNEKEPKATSTSDS